MVVSSIIISSCSKENRWDCIKRTGERVTDTRILPPFTKIYLQNNIDVFITQGATQEVKIEAGKNLISLIETDVVNGELQLKNDNKCNWARSYKKGEISVYITMPTLTYITDEGSGQIKSQNAITCDVIDIWAKESGDVDLSVNASTVYVQIIGSSDVTLHGTTSLLGVFHASEGYLYANDLIADIAWTDSQASGREYINAKNSLAATIEWSGDVFYSGTPSLSKKITGTGKLIQE